MLAMNRLVTTEESESSESGLFAGYEESQDWLVIEPRWVVETHQLSQCPSLMN